MESNLAGAAIASTSSRVPRADDPASLDRLADIVSMPSVLWWPPAIGWYFVIGTFILISILILVAALMNRQRNAYRRLALAELDRAASGPNALIEISAILKRTALAIMPRQAVAALSGERWMQWLEQMAPGVIFSESSRQLLTQQLYRCEVIEEEQLRELVLTSRAWLLKHRLKAQTDHATQRI